MKSYLLLVSVFTLILLNHSAFGQTQKTKEPFPSYTQIKPQKADIVDHISPTYVSPDGTVRVEKTVINLFDYPTGTVTYILNGKSSTDVDSVKQVVSEKWKDIESISVGKPDPAGKRVIEINYNLP
ncbi:MAG TPA: hypothetical protein VK404_01675 [Spirosoma sp.]|jgi:hypothetical protein|nr:hypothetical protein [Spirosoma sp.]